MDFFFWPEVEFVVVIFGTKMNFFEFFRFGIKLELCGPPDFETRVGFAILSLRFQLNIILKPKKTLANRFASEVKNTRKTNVNSVVYCVAQYCKSQNCTWR